MIALPVPELFTRLYEARRGEASAKGEPAWLTARREAAFAKLVAAGFPTIRVEDWKYTNLRPLLEAHLALPRATTPAEVGNLLPRRLEDECEIIFVDGHFAPKHSRYDGLPGVRVVSLEDGLQNGMGERLRAQSEAVQPGDDSPFVCLNAALSGGGVYIEVARGAAIPKRLHVLFLTSGAQPGVLVSPRVLIDVGEGADVRVAQSHIGRPGAVSLTNVVTDLRVGAEGRLYYSKIQSEAPEAFHVSYTRCRQGAGSHVTHFDFSLGAKLARNDLYMGIDGEGAEVHLNGLYAVKDRQHLDHHTTVDHRVPRGTSRQVYKGILNGSARAVFNGRVCVQPGAKLTDGYQINQNLLLSRTATVDTKPQLEIANDDVKCTHGATIGQIAEDQRFYLQSRGIPPDLAVAMLSRGFVEDVLFLMRDKPLQDSLRGLLAGYFEEA